MPTNRLKNPIIFIGAPRSGTTIISEMIFQHPDLAWPSNFQEAFPSNLTVNYLRRFFDNDMWRLIGNKQQLHTTSFLNKYYFKPAECYGMWEYITGGTINFSRDFLIEKQAEDQQKEFIRDYFSKMVQGQNRKRLSFKITGPPRMGYLLSIFPDAVFIMIKRKPVPTINSLLKVGFWEERGKKQLWWTGPYSEEEKKWAFENKNNPVLITALQIKKINWAEQAEFEKYKPDLLEIHYEDFVEQSVENINKILGHCGLSFDNRIEKYLEKNPVVSRNKNDHEYFDEETLQKINSILNGQLI